MAAKDDDVTKTTVLYDVDFDPKNIIKAASTLEREMSRRFKVIQKSEEGVNKRLNKYLTRMGSAKKVFGPVLRDQVRLLDTLRNEVDRYGKTLEVLREQERDASGTALTDIQKQIQKQEKLLDLRREAVRKGESVETQAREQMEIPPDLFAEAAREAGEELLRPFAAFARKDLAGFMESGAKLAVSSMKGFKKLGTMDTKGSDLGVMMKSMAGMSKAMGPLLNTLSKFAPMLGLASSAIMGLIKLFVDAESGAKEFHKQILATASTSDILGRNMGNVAAASEELKATLQDARAGAMAWSNVQWGISKEVAGAFTSAVTAEGVTLRQLGGDTDDAAAQTKEFTRVTQQAVAYSRAYGVSLNEVAQLQGEWQSEVGMGAKSIQVAYQTIAQGAADAGIRANKFFGIIRSFSADLTLFTLRLADVTKVMTALGQTMSPRDAQKFMQALTQKFGGGDIMDTLRHTVIGGAGKARTAAKADVEGRIPAVLDEIKKVVGDAGGADLEKLLRNPKRDPRAIAKWQAEQERKTGKKLNGALIGNVQDVAFAMDQLAKGGAVNTASVLGMLSPLGKFEQLQRESVALTGKRIEDASGENILALQSTGIATVDEIRNAIKFEQGFLALQEKLLDKVAQGQVTDKERARLEQTYGVQLTGSAEDNATALRELFKTEAGRTKFWNGMSKSDKALIDDSEKQIDYQKETSGYQVSTIDKLGIIVDVLMNYVYDALMGIWDTITNLPFFKDAGKDMEVKAARLRDPMAMEAVKSAGGDTWKARTNLIETTGKKMLGDIRAGVAEHATLAKQLGTTEDKHAQEAIKARMKELDPLLQYAELSAQDLYERKGFSGRNRKEVRIKRDPEQVMDLLLQMSDSLRKARAAGGGGATATAVTGGPVVGAPGTAPEAPPETTKAQEATTDSVDQVGKTLKEGVALSKPTSAYKDAVQNTTLDALRTGLFEYYMYSGLNRMQVAAGMKSGAFTGANFGKMIAGGVAAKGVGPEAVLGEALAQAAPNAEGGIVTSIVNGKANTMRLPPGEGWAPVGRGEAIVPAGGRGGGGTTRIELELKGDLRRFVDARVVDGTANFERNKRLR